MVNSKQPKTEIIDMGELPGLYTILGIKDRQLKTNGKTILKALGIKGRNKHKVSLETMENLLSLTYNPEAVFKSLSVSDNPKAYIAVLNAKAENQDQIVAILSPSNDGKGFTFIPSVYEKQNFDRFLSRIHEEQKVLYIKDKGSNLWGQLQSLPRHNSEPYVKSILTKDDVVKRLFNPPLSVQENNIKENTMSKAVGLDASIYDFQDNITTTKKLIDDLAGKNELFLEVNYYQRSNNGVYHEPAKDRVKQNSLCNPDDFGSSISINKDAFEYAKLKNAKILELTPEQANKRHEDYQEIFKTQGIDRKRLNNDLQRKYFDMDGTGKQAINQPLSGLENIIKENTMSNENVFYPSTEPPSISPEDLAFRNTLHQRNKIVAALENGTLSCLPGPDGFADTKPAINLMNGGYYHSENLLYLKEHQKKHDFPTAEYLTANQINKANQDNPEISLKKGQNGVGIHFSAKDEKTENWETKNFVLFNIAQTTNPEKLKDWIAGQEQKKIDRMQDQFSESFTYKPKQDKGPGPTIACTSTEPEQYLGQYLAAVSMGGKFKATPEQANEFSEKFKESLNEKLENGYPDPYALKKVARNASRHCKDVIREIGANSRKQNQEQKIEQKHEQKKGRKL